MGRPRRSAGGVVHRSLCRRLTLPHSRSESRKRASAIVEECDVRLRAHMRALPAPAENVQTLAEILGEDLAAWPPTAWLVIDDYHEVAQEPQAEDFVHALASVSPIQFLIASRVRPSWVTTKDRLYGEALEVSQTALAMDNREAADVLVERSEDSASGLVTLANGWPAVIGLASVSSAEIEDGVEAKSPSRSTGSSRTRCSAPSAPDVRQGLTTLAVAPVIDGTSSRLRSSANDGAETVTAAALDVGLLVERDDAPRPPSAGPRVPRGEERPARLASFRRCRRDLSCDLPRATRVGCGLRPDQPLATHRPSSRS